MNSSKKTFSLSTSIIAIVLSIVGTVIVIKNSCPLQCKSSSEIKQDYVILMNPFKLEPDQEKVFLTRWLEVAGYMKKQPGFMETSLHKGVKDSTLWFNYAKWRSKEAFLDAISTKTFEELTKYFPGEGAPQLYEIHTQYTQAIYK